MTYTKPSAGRLDSRQNATNYDHPQETNLLNIHKALDYNGEGKPSLRILSDHEAASRSAFGEPLTVLLTPIIQLDGLYGFDPRDFEQITAAGGSIDQGSNKTLMKTHTGTSANGYALVRSNRIARYRPGQGMMARFTAMYENPQAGVTLRAGLIAQEQSLVVGYNGTQFGVMRQNGGKAEIVKLTISSNTIGTVSITLNGVVFSISATTTNTSTTAREIASASFTGWFTEQIDNNVYFVATLNGVKTPATYSVGGTASGTISVVQNGVANTENWTYQSDFNIDKLDGTGVSQITLDPSKLNIFQIQFRWLGVGEIRYAMENPHNGDLIFFHHEHYSNRNTDVHLNNPSFRIGYLAANLTSNSITDSHCAGASMLVANEGESIDNSFTTSTNSSKTSLNANNVHHLLTLKNRLIYQDKINLRRVKLKNISVAYQGNDPAILYLMLNGTLSASPTFNIVGNYNSVVKSSTTGTFTIANEVPLTEFVIPVNGALTYDLDNLGLVIPPNNRLNIAISSGQQISAISVAITWIEV